MEFHKHLNKIGIKTNPRPLDMMLYATGQHDRIKKLNAKTPKGYIKIQTCSFGDMFIPEKLAQKSVVLGFLP